MPAYNAEKYIGEAIESILNQTFKDFEFIIIDDCSTDTTGNIIDDYAIKDDRIRVFHSGKNLFVAGATNLAIHHSRASILARMDADDIAMLNRLEKQYDFLINNPNVAVIGAWIEIINEKGSVIGIRKYLQDDVNLKKKMFRYSPFAHPVVMYRKDVVQKFGNYKETRAPAEDSRLWFAIGTQYKFANVQEILLKYRFFDNSTSNKKLRLTEMATLKHRWHAWRHQGYKLTFLDFIYNIGQLLTIYLMPVKWRIKLFNIIRKIF